MTGRRGRRAALAALLVAAGLVGGCAAPPASPPAGESSPPPAPLADCAGLTEPPDVADGTDAPATVGGGDGERLPHLTLPCFTDGEPVALAELHGPAVVNLWASWCAPCRRELPVLQEYADATAGRVHVVGVVTEDRHDAAAWFADDAQVSFPSLYDREGRLYRHLGAAGLPVTLFVAADGRVVHRHPVPVDADTLAELSTEHLGVAP